jgi:hypothetical protein
MRFLVCGGRDFSDWELLDRALSFIQKWYGISCIIEGDFRGADRMAGYWARKHRITNHKFPADWKKHGKRAGPIRNQQMLDEGRPDYVVAFPGDRGTADMVARARRSGVEVVEAIKLNSTSR